MALNFQVSRPNLGRLLLGTADPFPLSQKPSIPHRFREGHFQTQNVVLCKRAGWMTSMFFAQPRQRAWHDHSRLQLSDRPPEETIATSWTQMHTGSPAVFTTSCLLVICTQIAHECDNCLLMHYVRCGRTTTHLGRQDLLATRSTEVSGCEHRIVAGIMPIIFLCVITCSKIGSIRLFRK